MKLKAVIWETVFVDETQILAKSENHCEHIRILQTIQIIQDKWIDKNWIDILGSEILLNITLSSHITSKTTFVLSLINIFCQEGRLF